VLVNDNTVLGWVEIHLLEVQSPDTTITSPVHHHHHTAIIPGDWRAGHYYLSRRWALIILTTKLYCPDTTITDHFGAI